MQKESSKNKLEKVGIERICRNVSHKGQKVKCEGPGFLARRSQSYFYRLLEYNVIKTSSGNIRLNTNS